MSPEFLPTHLRSLRLHNFTAFADATFEFVPGINVLTGENGTGKTHVLKLLYTRTETWGVTGVPVEFDEIFGGPHNASYSRGKTNDVWWKVEPGKEEIQNIWSQYRESTFIPPTDMMGHAKGYLAIERNYRIDFDATYGDLITRLQISPIENDLNIASTQMQIIEDRLGGTVGYDSADDRFYLSTKDSHIPMPLVAEGLRKFATLHTIWKNGWLRPGTCLFWDEPEANLNPSLMDEIVAAILALARGGVQVFLATHSYVILKELEVQTTADDAVRFFALEKTEEGTKVHPADRYLDLKPNLIEDQYASLFDRAIEKRLREQAERV